MPDAQDLILTIKLFIMESKIVTEYIHPPIPIRNYDWQAARDGWDLDDPIGHGRTEQLAIDDLTTQEWELEN